MVFFKARDRRWCSSEVQSDLYLLCADGEVAAHSAYLAELSPMLATILSRNWPCSNCRDPLVIQLTDFTTADCRALISLLYKGFSDLKGTKIEQVISLIETLRIDLKGLTEDKSKDYNKAATTTQDVPADSCRTKRLDKKTAQAGKQAGPAVPEPDRRGEVSTRKTEKPTVNNQQKTDNSIKAAKARETKKTTVIPSKAKTDSVEMMRTRRGHLKRPSESPAVQETKKMKKNKNKENITENGASVLIPAHLIESPVKQEKPDIDSWDNQSPVLQGREADDNRRDEIIPASIERQFSCEQCHGTFTFRRHFDKHKCSIYQTTRLKVRKSLDRQMSSSAALKDKGGHTGVAEKTDSKRVSSPVKYPPKRMSLLANKPISLKAAKTTETTLRAEEVEKSRKSTPIGRRSTAKSAIHLKKLQDLTIHASGKPHAAQLKSPAARPRTENTSRSQGGKISEIANKDFVDAITAEPDATFASNTKNGKQTLSSSPSGPVKRKVKLTGRPGSARKERWSTSKPTKSTPTTKSRKKSAEKLEQCSVCQRNSPQIEVHTILRHMKERMLKQSRGKNCSICGDQYEDSNELALHIGLYHGLIKEASN